jgi:hypothetical protein
MPLCSKSSIEFPLAYHLPHGNVKRCSVNFNVFRRLAAVVHPVFEPLTCILSLPSVCLFSSNNMVSLFATISDVIQLDFPIRAIYTSHPLYDLISFSLYSV